MIRRREDSGSEEGRMVLTNMTDRLFVMKKRRNDVVYAGMNSHHNFIVGPGKNVCI